MKREILILSLALLTFGSVTANVECDCTELTTSTECAKKSTCVWSTTCSTKSCSDYSD